MILLLIILTLTSLLVASAALHERDRANARVAKYETVYDANRALRNLVVNVRVINGDKARLRIKLVEVIVRFAVLVGNLGAAQITT